MKKLMLVLLLMLPMHVYGQTTEQAQKPDYVFKGDPSSVAKEYEIDYLRNCLHGYYKERSIGSSLTIGGIAVSSLLLTQNSEQTQKTLCIAGGVLCLAGTILTLDAEKWLLRSSIKPSTSGFGVTVNFNKPVRKYTKSNKVDNDDLYR